MSESNLTLLNSVNELESLLNNSVIENLKLDSELASNYQLDIKRDDLIHPIISGNKWRKLKYLLSEIERQGFKRVAAMGGRHSNFLHALSYICYLLGWKCELYIRGHQQQQPTPTLIDCETWGAKITLVDRVTFKRLRDCPPELANDVYWIPEGGQQYEASLGVSEIIAELPQPYDYIVIASATGTSVAGLVLGVEKSLSQNNSRSTEIIGISVLNNQAQQSTDVQRLIANAAGAWQIKSGYEFGGFAKQSNEVEQFCQWFLKKYQIAIEPIYTGRAFYAVFDLINKQYFNKGSRILLLHCGGLQGARKILPSL